MKDLVRGGSLGTGSLYKSLYLLKDEKQAGAELCQAQEKLGLA